jgi:hypothetical protein
MDLPGELRNKVYKILLCPFEPPPPSIGRHQTYHNCSLVFSSVPAKHSVDTGILRANSQIHREAYDVMVKTNRFVRIRCIGYLPLESIFLMGRVPVVASEECVSKFNGSVPIIPRGMKFC